MHRLIGLVLFLIGAGLLYYDAYLVTTGRQLDTFIYTMSQFCHSVDHHAWIAGFSHTAIMLLGGIILYSPELKRFRSRSPRR